MNDQSTNSSGMLWYVIGAIVLIALAFWYFSSRSSAPASTSTAVEDNAALSAELDQVPDGSAELNQAASASAAAIQSF